MAIAEHHVLCEECQERSIIELSAEEDSPASYECPKCGARAHQEMLVVQGG